MPIKIGITGGIGTGKSFVSKIFQTMGIPFYDADKEAKIIMSKNHDIKVALIEAFGHQTYFEDGTLNRKWLSSQVFDNEDKLSLLNGIVHPIVIKAAEDWADSQISVYCLKEAALLFESGSYKSLDAIILVTAPLELRIERVIQRDGVTRDQVLDRINNQMPEEDKMKMADYIIVNDEITALLPQILKIHQNIVER